MRDLLHACIARSCAAQVDWTKQRRMARASLGNHVFKPTLKQAKKRVPLHRIPGFAAKPSWNSPGATSLVASTIDLYTAQWASQQGKWDELDRTWWACLLRGPQLVFRKRASDRWMLSLGDEVNAVLAWPVSRVQHSAGSYHYFVPDVSGDSCVEVVHICDPSEFEAATFDWVSPPSQFLKVGGKCAELIGSRQSLHMVEKHTPRPLLEVVARNCFWDFSLATCNKILRELFPDEVVAGDDHFDVLQKLVGGILACSGEETVEILRQRVLKRSSEQEALLELDEAVEVWEPTSSRS